MGIRETLIMMTSSNGNISALLVFCAGNSPVPVNSPHKGQWRGALMFSLICARRNRWVNNREAGDLRRHQAHYDVNVMSIFFPLTSLWYFETWRSCHVTVMYIQWLPFDPFGVKVRLHSHSPRDAIHPWYLYSCISRFLNFFDIVDKWFFRCVDKERH